MIVRRLVFVVCCLSVLASQAQNNARGRVLDQDRNAVAKAIVTVLPSGAIALTDSSGVFSFSDLLPGKVDFRISADGFRDTSVVRDVPMIFDIEMIMSRIPLPVADTTGMAELLQHRLLLKTLVFDHTYNNTPVPRSRLSRSEIDRWNSGQDMPYILRNTPSMVVTSDAGNGVGYTGMWIRGSDGSRINVTVNGVALNDAESQQVFWVDLPDVASTTDRIEIQRGVGASTNGTGAFGATIRLDTEDASPSPYAQIVNAGGSFNTWKHNVQFGSGLIDDMWSVEGRLSRITSDGYIDRASSRLSSYHLSSMMRKGKTTLRLMSMGGHERTYQSWYGTPQSRVEGDREAMLQHAANNGYTTAQTQNLLFSGRTYNYYLYEDQVDDYTQNHYQLNLDHVFSNTLRGKVTGFYTRGFGYYEQYREDEEFGDIGMASIHLTTSEAVADAVDEEGNLISQAFMNQQYNSEDNSFDFEVQTDENGDTLTDANGNALLIAHARLARTDLVRQRWLDNHYYGTLATLTYSKGSFREITGGVNLATYDGAHYGKLTWMEHAVVPPGYTFYDGKSLKYDAAAFVKSVYAFPCRFEITADMQVRQVDYRASGLDVDMRHYVVDDDMLFFNPKLGVAFSRNLNVYYASASVANREPSRNDYVDAPQGVKPRPESMIDFEAGFRHFNPDGISYSFNAYAMVYRDQLVLTGELNDVGAPIRTNVAQSYRAGLESEVSAKLTRHFTLNGNLTLSRNKITAFDEILYDYTDGFEVLTNRYTNTDISFSPNIIASVEGLYTRTALNGNKLQAGVVVKHVGRQFLDNTSNSSRMLSDYTVADAVITCETGLSETSRVSVGLRVMNLFNRLYSANGYTYSYILGETVTENFYYPQATRYFMLEAALTFGK